LNSTPDPTTALPLFENRIRKLRRQDELIRA
jgi:hypothetical protein